MGKSSRSDRRRCVAVILLRITSRCSYTRTGTQSGQAECTGWWDGVPVYLALLIICMWMYVYTLHGRWRCSWCLCSNQSARVRTFARQLRIASTYNISMETMSAVSRAITLTRRIGRSDNQNIAKIFNECHFASVAYRLTISLRT